MPTNRAKSTEWLSADSPIHSRKEDILGRRGFSEALAHAVSGWLGRESLVIALYGDWGNGKSSIKNMMLECLDSEFPEVLTVDFNPWQLANRPKLSQTFFDELGVALGKGDLGSNSRKKSVLALYRRWVSRLQGGQDLIRAARHLFGTVLLVLGIATISTAWVHSVTLRFLLGGFTVLAGALAFLSKFAEAAIKFLEAGTENGSKSLSEVKDEIAKDLRKLKAPILVVLDDLDRLTADEAVEVFQLIKANGDFPNVIYLLLCERSVVERNVGIALNVPGRDYLEKIVQVAFDVPMIDAARVHRALFQRLDVLVSPEPISSRFAANRWSEVYLSSLHAYFATLRDVNRFCSTLAFQFSSLSARGAFEVNPIDLIGLEVMRLYEPDVYKAVQSSKEILTSSAKLDKPEADAARKAVESIVQLGSENRRTELKSLIKRLFPTVDWALDGSHYASDFDDRWHKDLRVCSPKFFDRYFRLAVSEQELSQSDVQALLRSRGNREQFKLQLEALNVRGLLNLAFEELAAYEDTIEPAHVESYVTGTFDVADSLPEESRGMMSIPMHWRIGFLVSHALKKLPDSTARLRALTGSVSATRGLYMPIQVVALLEPEAGSNSNVLSEADLAQAQRTAVRKIQAAADDGSLALHPKLAIILALWQRWGGHDEVKRYIDELTKTDAGTLHLLRSFLVRSLSQGSGEYIPRERLYIRRKDVEVFLPMERLAEKVRAVSTSGLTEEDQRAIQEFERAAERLKAGKSDDSPFAEIED